MFCLSGLRTTQSQRHSEFFAQRSKLKSSTGAVYWKALGRSVVALVVDIVVAASANAFDHCCCCGC